MFVRPCWTCKQPATHTLTRGGSIPLDACDNCTRIDRAEAESRGWTITKITVMHTELEAALRDWNPCTVALPDETSISAQVRDLRRLLEKVAIDENGCWRWTGFISHKGYGRFRFAKNVGHAHRFAYVMLVGPIGDGLEIDHRCRVRDCINPKHLEAVTHAENLKRRHPSNLPTHCGEGHEYTPENTYVRPNGVRICRICKRAEKARYRARVAAREAR
jgi:hypothetical protein